MVSLALKKACRNPFTAACDKSAGKGETNTPGGSCWGRRTRAGRIKALASLSLRNRRRCVWVLPGSGEDRGGWLGGVGREAGGWGGGLRGWLVKRVKGRACPRPTPALGRPFPFPTPFRLAGPLPRCWRVVVLPLPLSPCVLPLWWAWPPPLPVPLDCPSGPRPTLLPPTLLREGVSGESERLASRGRRGMGERDRGLAGGTGGEAATRPCSPY